MTKKVITEFTDRNQFQEFVNQYKGSFIVKFTADWCGPCKKIKDHVYNLYNNTKSTTIMADLDIDKNQDVYSYLKIKSIPTFICYTRGIKCDVLVGSGEDDVSAFFESCEKHN